jgi:hypothetical protein
VLQRKLKKQFRPWRKLKRNTNTLNEMSEEKKEPKIQLDQESALHGACSKRVDWLLTYSHPIYFLLGAIEKAGCSLPKGFIECR